MGVIYKLQKTVTSQVSSKISDAVSLFMRKRKQNKTKTKTKRETVGIETVFSLCLFPYCGFTQTTPRFSQYVRVPAFKAVLEAPFDACGCRRLCSGMHSAGVRLICKTKQNNALPWDSITSRVTCTTETPFLLAKRYLCVCVPGSWWGGCHCASASPCGWCPSSRRLPPFPLMIRH